MTFLFLFLRATSLDNLYHHFIYNSLDIVYSLCCDYFEDIYGKLRGMAMAENTVKKVALLVYYNLQYRSAVDLMAQRLVVTAAVAVLGTRMQPARVQGLAQASAPARALALDLAWSQAAERTAKRMTAEMLTARRVAVERIPAGRTTAETVAVD
jgi:hypothetical protein